VSNGPKINYAVLGGGLLLVVPLVAILASGFGNDPRALPDTMTGKPAPPFELVTNEGETVSLASLKGKPVVLNFWSTWCQPCKLEHPYLQQAAVYNPDVAFYGVLYSDDPRKAKIYLAREGSTYPVLLTETDRLAIEYGVTGVPETFFIDKDGIIVHKEAGPLSPPRLNEMLAKVRR